MAEIHDVEQEVSQLSELKEQLQQVITLIQLQPFDASLIELKG